MALKGTNQEFGRPYNRRIVLESIRVHGPMTRGDIGNYLGLTVETISRLLGRFQKSGLISVKGKYITVLDHVALGVMAGATRPPCG